MTTTTFPRTPAAPATGSPPPNRWARIGAVGFAFFFIKGLLWAVAPALLWLFR